MLLVVRARRLYLGLRRLHYLRSGADRSSRCQRLFSLGVPERAAIILVDHGSLVHHRRSLLLYQVAQLLLILDGGLSPHLQLMLFHIAHLSDSLYFLSDFAEIRLFLFACDHFSFGLCVFFPAMLLFSISFLHVDSGPVQVVFAYFSVIIEEFVLVILFGSNLSHSARLIQFEILVDILGGSMLVKNLLCHVLIGLPCALLLASTVVEVGSDRTDRLEIIEVSVGASMRLRTVLKLVARLHVREAGRLRVGNGSLAHSDW